MRVFVTGATGFIGSAVVQELLGAGHEVLGLARTDAGAQSVLAAGAKVQRGDLTDLESLRSGAAQSDGVIHTAFIHDFSKFEENCKIDQNAIEAIGDVYKGTNKPLVITSGTGLLGFAGLPLADEDTPPSRDFPRVASEDAAKSIAEHGVRSAVLRLPPTVHGVGDHGFVPLLIALARKRGAAAYVGEGANLWPAVHRLDAARLYRLILENGMAGAVYHGVAEEGVPFRVIAGVIGKRLSVPVVSKSPEEAPEHFGWFSLFASLNNPTSSKQTREALNWQPTHAGLLADLDQPAYFEVASKYDHTI